MTRCWSSFWFHFSILSLVSVYHSQILTAQFFPALLGKCPTKANCEDVTCPHLLSVIFSSNFWLVQLNKLFPSMKSLFCCYGHTKTESVILYDFWSILPKFPVRCASYFFIFWLNIVSGICSNLFLHLCSAGLALILAWLIAELYRSEALTKPFIPNKFMVSY